MTDQPAPSRQALAAARPFLRTLSSARQVYALYPEGHPNRRATVQELVADARALYDASVGDPVLFVARHSLYLGPTLLARESLSLFNLVKTFESIGIEAVEITRGVTDAAMDRFAEALHEGRLPTDESLVGLRVNRVKPRLSGQEALEVRLSDLRQAYAAGLQHLREQSLRVASGQPVDLEGATRTVETLAAEVVRDPAHALLLTTVKSFDEYTYYHMLNVCLLSVALATSIGLREDQVVALGIGALLHDVGKVTIPDDVLHHVGKLSEEQWRIVQRHPVEGAGLIFGTSEGMFHPAATVVLEHHAAYDLGGYPALSRRDRPSLPARLVSVADCFDAVTAKRSYRAPATRLDALQIIEAGSGNGFDPRFVRVFTRLLGLFPVGSLVRLDTGDTAVVVDNDTGVLSRPRVMRVLDAAGSPVDGEQWDLSEVGPNGEYRWHVVDNVDADVLGIDVMELLVTGSVELAAVDSASHPEGGLVHEPSHGETPPDAYVDTHREGGHQHGHGGHDHHHHDDQGQLDPDIAPPLEEPGSGS